MSLRIPDMNEKIQPESQKIDLIQIEEEPSNELIEVGNENVNDNLLILRKLHRILKNCQNLNSQQKMDFCNSERYFMKLYLKELARR